MQVDVLAVTEMDAEECLGHEFILLQGAPTIGR